MISKPLFITLSNLILLLLCVDSYVLFAANIDDFRSLANKIIPGQLADQLADMAGKRVNSNVRHKINKAGSEVEEDSSDASSDGSYSDSHYKTANPLNKDKVRAVKKKYMLHKDNIDLDELAKIVKEKLEKDYNVTDTRYATTKNTQEGKIDDYYYKDETLNLDINHDTEYETVTKAPSSTTKRIKYAIVPQHVSKNINKENENNNVAADYARENIYSEYTDEIVSKKEERVTKKHNIAYLAKPEKVIGYHDDEQDTRNFNDPSKVIARNDSRIVKNIEKNDQEYYDINMGLPEVIKIANPKDVNDEIGTNSKEPEYYDEKDVRTESVGGEIFKEIDMLKPSNDSYEDYITPERDDIFESVEPTTQRSIKPGIGQNKDEPTNEVFKLQHSRPKAFVEPQAKLNNPIIDEVIKPPERKVSAVTPQPEFIRAKTASMWYQNPNIANYDDATKKFKENVNKRTTKRRLTMVPTKAHIKISSPNYFAKLPAVAEKYNFDEPIPEKDREPEVIMHIQQEPAMINKKIRI